jgi:integrase
MDSTQTAKVIVRHALSCPDRRKGPEWRKCDCRKSLVVYDGTTRNKQGLLTNRVISAKTRSWSKAEKDAQDWLDSFDPEKQELKRLRAEKVRQQIRIEDAVALYLADLVARLGDNGTVAMARSLLGHVDPNTKQVTKNGHLFDWLDKQVPRPAFLAELTPALLTEWRASWKFNDLTSRQRWTMVRGFFAFCEAQGWVEDSPARKLKALIARKGNRTAVFTDEQYENILAAIPAYDPENVPAATRQHWQRRLQTFLELMRWTGMDLVDAVQYAPALVDADGVLRYRRQKTGVLATIPLPERLVVLLRDVPLERDSVGPHQPFRQRDCTVGSDTRTWARRLEALFALAAITEVTTDQRTRTPHAKMLRDTFAVWHLRHGAKLHTVSKMLGHTKTSTTEAAYLPWVKELEEAHIADARKSLEQMPQPKAGNVVGITSRRKTAN